MGWGSRQRQPWGRLCGADRLVRWAQDPAIHGQAASWRELPSVQYGSFSPSPALARACACSLSLSLFLSLSPHTLHSLPSPAALIPECSLCSAGPGCGLAVSGPSGGFSPPSGRRRSAKHRVPDGVCSRVCVRVPGRAASSCARELWRLPSLLPSLPPFLLPSVRSPTSLRSLSLIHPAEGLAHSLLLC